ncbi:hypothetical protein OC835_001689 [Tilletia horrida]|nr:hypothetical protein OC835_001689 [Tilletia horrida]
MAVDGDSNSSVVAPALTAAAADKDAGQGQDADAAPAEPVASAMTRVLGMPELLGQILSYLKRDRRDLLATSCVSRRFRAASVPHLLRDMDIALHNIGRVTASFKHRNSRRLLEHVKHLRIWDDEVHHRFRFEEHGSPSYLLRTTWRCAAKVDLSSDADETADPRWSKDIMDFLDFLTLVRRQSMPLIDLSLGLISTAALNQALTLIPEAAERIAALRIITDCFDKCDSSTPDLVTAELNGKSRSWWLNLTNLLQTICKAQDLVKSKPFKLFSLECHRISTIDPIATEVWHSIATTLCDRIEDLTIQFSDADGNFDNYVSVFEPQWSGLRRVQIKAPLKALSHTQWRTWSETIENFLTRHDDLYEFHIEAALITPCLTLNQTFPNLERVTIGHRVPHDVVRGFLTRHPKLLDFAVTYNEEHGLVSHLLNKGKLMAQLQTARLVFPPRTFRASVGTLPIAMLDISSLAELEIITPESTRFEEVGRPKALKPSCVALELTNDPFENVIAQAGHAFHWSLFPNLAELVICCTQAADVIKENGVQSAKRLRQLLLALASARSLRALHVEYVGSAPLPATAHLNQLVRSFPPKLEYIAWHAPLFNRTQYYRVIKKDVMPSWPTRALELLPASSRLCVDERGIWNQTGQLRRAKVFLDHSVSPPCLPA